MTHFRMDVSAETGAVMLYMESAGGYRPLIGWDSTAGMKEFAEMLLEIYHRRERDPGRIREVSNSILEQVIRDDADLFGAE